MSWLNCLCSTALSFVILLLLLFVFICFLPGLGQKLRYVYDRRLKLDKEWLLHFDTLPNLDCGFLLMVTQNVAKDYSDSVWVLATPGLTD